ncbi:SSI family serine proteinase inhibitor [Nonomuraea purpurea]|uniref:SSI family serine proteinase inhibitor n=1 Tax=Nonomuraea purpurea TaxID=1849276 RepID=A0ABV8G4V1_9ACTN
MPLIQRAVAVPAFAAALFVTAAPAHAEIGQLEITRYDVRSGEKQQWYLACDPDGGTHPDPVGACDRLRGSDADLERLRFGPAPCPKIYDPVEVEIVGYWNEEPRRFRHRYPNPCSVRYQAAPVVL